MTIGTMIYTWLRGEEMGRDEFGNRYYRDKTGVKRARREKRWVVYQGDAEATKVPPDWHAWLHHLSAAPPPPVRLTEEEKVAAKKAAKKAAKAATKTKERA